jgi:hypothetical protein
MQLFPLPLLLVSTILIGCAQASTIEDTEPEVTRSVAVFLEQIARNEIARSAMTDRAGEALDVRAVGAQLQPCPRPLDLALLDRRTKGEDRLYLYRAACGAKALLVEVDFNKAAKINRLLVRLDAQ